MKMLGSLLATLLAGCATTAAVSTMQRPDAPAEAGFMQLRMELQAALANRDRPALQRLLAPSFIFVHSTGKLEQRAEFIARAMDAATDKKPPVLEFIDDDIRLYSDTAVWITHSRRAGTSMTFVGTDVLVRSDGRWQWVSVQSTRTDH